MIDIKPYTYHDDEPRLEVRGPFDGNYQVVLLGTKVFPTPQEASESVQVCANIIADRVHGEELEKLRKYSDESKWVAVDERKTVEQNLLGKLEDVTEEADLKGDIIDKVKGLLGIESEWSNLYEYEQFLEEVEAVTVPRARELLRQVRSDIIDAVESTSFFRMDSNLLGSYNKISEILAEPGANEYGIPWELQPKPSEYDLSLYASGDGFIVRWGPGDKYHFVDSGGEAAELYCRMARERDAALENKPTPKKRVRLVHQAEDILACVKELRGIARSMVIKSDVARRFDNLFDRIEQQTEDIGRPYMSAEQGLNLLLRETGADDVDGALATICNLRAGWAKALRVEEALGEKE